MSQEIDILRDQYSTIMTQETDWSFFLALNGYMSYILETPILKKLVNKVMEKRTAEYAKLNKLEDEALKEVKNAKNKLLKLVKKFNIAPDSLLYNYLSFSQTENVLKNLELFEKGEISKSGFKSENLENYLYDIAQGIVEQGHKDSIKEFIVSDEEYRDYHNDFNIHPVMIRNVVYEKFIFSKTLKLRREQVKFIEKTEKFELWGAFNALLKFQKAFLEKSENRDLDYIIKKYDDDSENPLEAKEPVDIVFFAKNLEEIAEAKNGKTISRNLYDYLKKDDFKNHLLMANNYLIKELAKTENKKEAKPKESNIKQKIVIDLQKGIYDATHTNLVYEISGKRLKIVEYLYKNNIASLSDLIAHTGQANYLIVKEITEINKNFRKCLKIKKDLIAHSKTSGYRLNKSELDIKTST